MKNTSTHFTTSRRNLSSLIFFSVSFILRYVAFSRTPYANGWDGYFYINQVKSFIEEGRMDVTDLSLVYPLMILVQFFTNDYVLSYKILSGLLAGAFTASLFLLALKWSANYRIALLAGTLSLCSPHLTYFSAQYPKNLLGVIFFIWLLYSLDSKKKILPVVLLVLNFFGHRATAVLGFIFLAIHTLVTRSRRLIPYILIIFLLLLVVAVPGLISFFDIGRFRGVLSPWPQFAPYSFVRSFGPDLISTWWLAEIIICCVAFVAGVVFAITRRPDPNVTLIVLILGILIFPFFEWSNDGPALRFFLMFILMCPVLLICLLRPVKIKYLFEGLCLVFAVATFFSFGSYDPSKHDPPYRLYGIVAKRIVSNVQPDSIELIIAHKSLAEFLVYSTGIDAMSWVPEYQIRSERLWRVAEGLKDVQYDFYLDPDDLGYVHRLTPSYSLIREDRWLKFITRVTKDGNDELLNDLRDWKNPGKMRPSFLQRNK